MRTIKLTIILTLTMKIDSYDNVLKWSYKLASIWAKENLAPLGINSSRKFEMYKRQGNYLPKNFPRKPDEYFKKNNVWQGWSDFFGKNGIHAEKHYLPYSEASKLCRGAGIKNSIEYRKWRTRPAKLPARPDQYYKEVWKDWQSFLGGNYALPERKLNSKLNYNDVRIIRHQLDLGISGSLLAKSFGVSEMQISRIKHGENWTKV
ncbi:MAG: hypothetical protein JXB34_00290 [Bacteroidales bacterium]|nr:hypothetical protein [Bacteroidales bacterium]